MSNSNENKLGNLWLSYSDLMAGLLFVFILLVGMIVAKTIFLKEGLRASKEEFAIVSQELNQSKKEIVKLKFDISQLTNIVAQKESMINYRSNIIKKRGEQLAFKNKTIDSQKQNIKILKQTLQQSEGEKNQYAKNISLTQSKLQENNLSLQEALERIMAYEATLSSLASVLNESNQTLTSQHQTIETLSSQLNQQEINYDALLVKMQSQKEKIKFLTGIKLKVITALKESLGDKINIDKKSGALRLASNILFDRDSAALKEESKEEISKTFENYIHTLMENKEIKEHIEQITIEGHTDSDGEYLYNLKLSQQRAHAVMSFLLGQPYSKQYGLEPLMYAAGRAYLDPIIANGQEDKQASRRIEIKFRLKNQDAMDEITKILDAQ